MNDAPGYLGERKRMIREQIVRRGVCEPRLLEALQQVPRHLFVPREYAESAYSDGPLPIGEGQTISQPYIVALMTDLLGLQGKERVLEVGTGSGYQAAILAYLAEEVHSIERHAGLAQGAKAVLQRLELKNVTIHVGDGSVGLAAYAPYQAIIVTAAAPQVPQPLLDQLDEGGRLVIPVGSRGMQTLERWVRKGASFTPEEILPVAFVPLRGEFGWHSDHHFGIFG